MGPEELIDRWYEATRELLPPDAQVWDCHTHTGQNDPDGFSGTSEWLLDQLEGAGQAGAACFAMHEPDGYPAANDLLLAEAGASGGRLVSFCRVDPHAGARSEAERCLDLGHVGIKLHPRSDGFELADPGVGEVMDLAAERGVPVIVHAGRGIPALGEHAVAYCTRLPGLRLILAHAGITDLAWLGPVTSDHPNLFFDTSWWNMADLLALFAWVPPGQILYGTDMPYGIAKIGAQLALRPADAAGYGPEALRSLMGDQLRRLVAREQPEPCGPPPSEAPGSADPGLARLHSHIDGAIARNFSEVDATEPLELARQACAVPPSTAHGPVYGAVLETLRAVDPHPEEKLERRRAVSLLVVAAAAALTPHAPVPEL